MEPDQAARRAAMERLEVFIGEWAMEASFPAAPAGVAGRAVFEWTLDRQFMVERAEVPEAPDSVAIVGFDPARKAYRQHYFDSRGIARVYAMEFRGGVWTLVRDAPDFTPLEFSQRFTGTFSGDGQRIDGRWETSRDNGSNWEHDFDLTYTKVR
jgi:hypothetical protein